MQVVDVQVSPRKLVINELVVVAELEGEAVLLNVETGVYFGLNEVGTRVWKFLEDRIPVEEMVTRLLEEYEVEAGQLRRDVSALLESLEAHGLLRE